MIIADGSFSVRVKNMPIIIGHITLMPKKPILIECYFSVRKEMIYHCPKFYCEGGELSFYLAGKERTEFIGMNPFYGEKVGIKEVDNELTKRVLEISKTQETKKETELEFWAKVKQDIKELIK